MTPPDTRHRANRRRTLTVLIDRLAVEDGQIEPPVVGAVTSFPLLFIESVGTQPDSMTVRATLEPGKRGPVEGKSWSWYGLLRGDGWTATWTGPRPRTGLVEVTGQFVGVIGIDATGRVRGRVTRVDVVTEYWNRVDTRERWTPVAGRRDYRAVDRSPRFFDDQRYDDPPEVARVEVGALITIDLDDVPELPLRKNFVAGSVSAHRTRLWAVDNQLPLLLHMDENSTPTTHLIPAPVAWQRSLWATPSGCWVSGSDGIYRVDADAETGERVSALGPVMCAVHGELLLACSAAGPWQILAPGCEPVAVDCDGIPIGAVADQDSFVVLLEVRESDHTRLRLVRISLTGDCTPGPLLPAISRLGTSMTQLVGDPLTVAHENGFTAITTDLGAGRTRPVPRTFFDAGAVGKYLWTIAHPPHPTSKTWWPLEGPTEYDTSRGQFWMLTILDRLTLQPVHTAAVLTPQPSVTCDSSGTIWLAAAGELLRIPDVGGTMQWPETVDVEVE